MAFVFAKLQVKETTFINTMERIIGAVLTTMNNEVKDVN